MLTIRLNIERVNQKQQNSRLALVTSGVMGILGLRMRMGNFLVVDITRSGSSCPLFPRKNEI